MRAGERPVRRFVACCAGGVLAASLVACSADGGGQEIAASGSATIALIVEAPGAAD